MQTSPRLLIALLLAAASSFAAPATHAGADTLRLTHRPYVSRGMSRQTVLEMFGAPSARLAADAWVYFDFRAVNAVATGTQDSAAAARQDALIVTFKADRVELIRACDSKPVRAFLAQQANNNPAGPALAAK